MSRYLAKAEAALAEASSQAVNLPPDGPRVRASIDIARIYAAMAAIDRGLPPGWLLPGE